MNLLAWIYRGLRNRQVVDELVELVQAKGPTIMFLSETRSDREHMKWVRCRLKFDGCFTFLVVEEGEVWLCYGGMKM